ncbi:PH domain-containing protein [Alkalihalobacillus sp. CinArs1]|uniref:PH domain-containing protein n=1 Tax=Alkalihalobacillus sp. CinArs1 TaxID=2995314 RepID=UPI0022DE3D38|nr:PH domain-containing protein [Alkalihalobacillus sp. CinArs1]
MFKKVASDVLGLSDVGSVIKPADYDKVDADDYVLHEDGEKIYFLIKSKADEYCFTNLALIHVDGKSATSSKRTLRRYEYSHNTFKNVALETAGTVDLDVEIKFQLGNEVFSIDVHKKFIEELKDLYKSLIRIAELSRENETYHEFSRKSLDLASSTLTSMRHSNTNLHEEFKQINEIAFNWLEQSKKQYTIKDFGDVFERYINN